MRIKKFIGICLWLIILFFLLVDFSFARGSKFPDPLEILKNLPPPTIDHNFDSRGVRTPDSKLPLNPLVNKKEQEKETKKNDPSGSGTKALTQNGGVPASGTGGDYRLVIQGTSPLILNVPSDSVSLPSGPGSSVHVIVASGPGVLTASVTVRLPETASGTSLSSVKKPVKTDKDKTPDRDKNAKATETASVNASDPKKIVGTKTVSLATETRLYSETASGTASDSSKTVASETVPASDTAVASQPLNASAAASIASGTAPPAGEASASTPTGVGAEILAKAEKLLKEGNWKDLNQFVNDNPALGDDDRGAQIRIVSAMNQPKVIATKVKDLSEALLAKKPDDPFANWGMGFYYLEGKKPDPGKALTCLSKAKAAKNGPGGLTVMYWKAFLKKYMIMLLVLLGGAIAGGNEIRKKIKAKKAAAAGAEAPPDGAATSDAATAATSPDAAGPPVEEKKWKIILGKARELVGKLLGKLLEKMKKKNAAASETPPGEVAADAEAPGAAESGDPLAEPSADAAATEDSPPGEEIAAAPSEPPSESGSTEPSPEAAPAESGEAAPPSGPVDEEKT